MECSRLTESPVEATLQLCKSEHHSTVKMTEIIQTILYRQFSSVYSKVFRETEAKSFRLSLLHCDAKLGK
jgi:NMD protein affecting ribosome stability and mRNA decay